MVQVEPPTFHRRSVCWICENKSRHRSYITEDATKFLGVPICNTCGTRYYKPCKAEFPHYFGLKREEIELVKAERDTLIELYWVELLANKVDREAVKMRKRGRGISPAPELLDPAPGSGGGFTG